MEILFEPTVKLLAMTYPVTLEGNKYSPSNINHPLEEIIEVAGRNCYKSKKSENEDKQGIFIDKIINLNHHESVAEHVNLTFEFTTRRDVMAEITRHRHASFSIESQRYVNYGKKGIKFVMPTWLDKEAVEWCIKEDALFTPRSSDIKDLMAHHWYCSRVAEEANYNEFLDYGCKPEQARGELSNHCATNIIMTANAREWRHIFTHRCALAAYSEMRVVAKKIQEITNSISPIIFPIKNLEDFDNNNK